MALSDDDRRAVWAATMREMSAANEPCGITKDQLRAAVDAIDGWVEANAVSFNAAIPEPARSDLSLRRKLALFMAVVRRRWEVG